MQRLGKEERGHRACGGQNVVASVCAHIVYGLSPVNKTIVALDNPKDHGTRGIETYDWYYCSVPELLRGRLRSHIVVRCLLRALRIVPTELRYFPRDLTYYPNYV